VAAITYSVAPQRLKFPPGFSWRNKTSVYDPLSAVPHRQQPPMLDSLQG
jgi:hypothetical protein